MTGIGGIGNGPGAYVRTAATNAAPGTVLASATVRAIAPAAVFVMASTPAVAEALENSPSHSPNMDYTSLWLGAGGGFAGLTGTIIAAFSIHSSPDNFSGFFLGVTSLLAGFSTRASAGLACPPDLTRILGFASCGLAIASWIFSGVAWLRNRRA